MSLFEKGTILHLQSNLPRHLVQIWCCIVVIPGRLLHRSKISVVYCSGKIVVEMFRYFEAENNQDFYFSGVLLLGLLPAVVTSFLGETSGVDSSENCEYALQFAHFLIIRQAFVALRY